MQVNEKFACSLWQVFFRSIILSGPQGVYAFHLCQSLTNQIAFENRCRDVFLVDIDDQFDEIEYIVLEHNNENSSPAWFVDFVLIKFLHNAKEYLYEYLTARNRRIVFLSFSIHRWLSIDFFDGKTKITLSSDVQKASLQESKG